MEKIIAAKLLCLIMAVSLTGPANPIHNCSIMDDWTGDTDMTKWSYVYFGNYPQTEVTGAELTSAITGASYDKNGDAVVKGRKYRRISKKDTNSNGDFGDNEYRYFRWEQIRWRVLSNNGTSLFVMADLALDSKNYHGESRTAVTWETCSLRSWLNSTFYNMAFSGSEQAAIIQHEVINEDEPEYGTEGGNNTRDKVYLPSLGEISNPSYGFCEKATATGMSRTRRIQPSDYTSTLMFYRITNGKYAGNCEWWLRSPGSDSEHVTVVQETGAPSPFNTIGASSLVSECVVPVLNIDITSSCWSENPAPPPADSEDEGENKEATNSEVKLTVPKLTIKIASANAVKLSWNKVNGAGGYHIYRASAKNGSYKKIKSVKGTSYTDSKLKSGKTYYYKAAAYKGSKTSAKSKAVSRKIIGKPKTPKMQFKMNRKKNKFTISWKPVKNAEKIEIRRSVDGSSFKKWKTVSAKKGKAVYNTKLLKKNHSYSFKLCAYYKKDGKIIPSGESKDYTFKY